MDLLGHRIYVFEALIKMEQIYDIIETCIVTSNQNPAILDKPFYLILLSRLS